MSRFLRDLFLPVSTTSTSTSTSTSPPPPPLPSPTHPKSPQCHPFPSNSTPQPQPQPTNTTTNTIIPLFPTLTASDLPPSRLLDEDALLSAIRKLPAKRRAAAVISRGGPGVEILAYSNCIAYKRACSEREARLMELASSSTKSSKDGRQLAPRLLCRVKRRIKIKTEDGWQHRTMTCGILMELARPFDLNTGTAHRLKSDDERKRVSCEAVELVRGLHGMGMVHGDVKPENFVVALPTADAPRLLVDPKTDGQVREWEGEPRLMLIDFAHAFRVSDDDGEGDDARAWRKGYSDGYVSPARLREEERMGRLAPPAEGDDLYALAVTLWRIWGGDVEGEGWLGKDGRCSWGRVRAVVKDDEVLGVIRGGLEGGGVVIED
ncbi:hypothetical protein B0T17DRAFT_648482 [Bombardia bombarda]|uniref:Protein kinase domain-containing protein n=1 Tax=Bombardia bombarda TaxID=252184 RepID=A0AA39U4R5_9PEZI|nr:hypothetical protein B0T17DRAFT_648482 [Bombardia bombarda]